MTSTGEQPQTLLGRLTGEGIAYLVLALAGFVGTQIALVAILTDDDSGASEIWEALTGTPTAVFVTIDLFVVFLAAMVLMVVDGRRIGLQRWWLYPVLNVAVGVSTGFPLFLLARRLHLSKATT